MSISSSFKFIRSTEMENEATRQILSLFTTAWEDTSKKSARDLMSLVLQTMQGACSVEQNTAETEESLKLKHANQYFEKLVTLFNSAEPLPMPISGNTFDDMIRNLNTIKSYAEKEEYGKDITDRINLFVRKCTEMGHQVKSNQITRFVIGGVGGALFAVLIFVVTGSGRGVNIGTLILGVLCIAAVGAVAAGTGE